MNPDLEFVSCHLCGADDAAVYLRAPVRAYRFGQYSRDVFEVVKCRRCGLVYVNPRLNAAARATFYKFENPVDRAFVENWFVESADLQRATWQRVLGGLRPFVARGRLLDVGCGAGSFLVEARQAGFEVAGTEVSPYFVEFCRARHQFTTYAGTLEELALEPASFDCITAFDVIEHHPEPVQMLRQIHALLKPGGFVMLTTHDIGNPFARLYGVRWRHMSPDGHLTFFTRATLGQMLKKAGFEVRRQGGLHTFDRTGLKTAQNWVVQFLRVIVLRGLILGLYKPLVSVLPRLTRWQARWGGVRLDHAKLMVRVGSQVIIDDDMVFIAQKG